MGVLSGNPKHQPMHYGEVNGVWTFLQANKSKLASMQKMMNHAGDKDLLDIMADAVKTTKEENAELEELLKANGIVPPPTPSDVPKADWEAIPPAARYTDMEIAAGLAKGFGLGMVTCSTIIAECIREDIGAMFANYHANAMGYSLRMLRLNKEKGWLIPPPLHVEQPELAHV